MEKTVVDLASFAIEELERLTRQFGIRDLDGPPEKLSGGYSSVNYKVVSENGASIALLRIAVGLPESVAHRQSLVLRAVATMGVQCPRTRMTPKGEYVLSCTTASGQQAFATVLEWVDGLTANKLAESNEAGMLRHLGTLLATLHSGSQPKEELGLQDVSSDTYLQCFMHWPSGMAPSEGLKETTSVAGDNHDIVQFLNPRVEGHLNALVAPGLPKGLLHGDPFLDNMMVGSAGATLLDWDEAAQGPFVYDLACAIVGGCFDGDGVLSELRLGALLEAYHVVRPLSQEEKIALPSLMQTNALLVAWYRWRNFHIDVIDAPADAKESFREMLRVHRTMEDTTIQDLLSSKLRSLDKDKSDSVAKRCGEIAGGVTKKVAIG